MKLLWLDDTRNPFEADWLVFSPIELSNPKEEVIWVKSYQEFIDWISKNGLPNGICFDHDLGIPKQLEYRAKGASKLQSRRLARETEKTGYDCAKWLVDYCINNNKSLPKYNIQSANPIGKENIDGYLKNYLKSLT